ncbi:O-antigen ligase family protein [Flavobacterium sp. 3-218]
MTENIPNFDYFCKKYYITMKGMTVNEIIDKTKAGKNIPDFLICFFIILLLLIDFMPYFKTTEIINIQFLYLSFLNLLAGIYLYVNNALIPPTFFSIWKKSQFLKIYIIFLVLCAASFFVAKNTSLVITKMTQILVVFCLFLNLSILLKDKLQLFFKIVFIVGIFAFLQSWQELCHFIIIPKRASIIDLLTNMKGNTGNINILAASLSIKVPFLLLGIVHYNGLRKYFLLFALFSVTAVIFLTGARTALLDLFAIYTVYIIYLLREYKAVRTTFTKILLLIIPTLISVLFANSIFEKSKDSGRYVSLQNRIGEINTNDASANVRLLYWENALKLAQKNPVLGIGLGNYRIESIPYEKYISDDTTVSLHTHNDFLEITSETGILNGLLYFALLALLFFINLKNTIKSSSEQTKNIAVLALMLVLVYGIDSFFNFPMYRPTMSIFFALILALTILNNSKTSEILNATRLNTKTIAIALIALSLLTSYTAYHICKASHLQYMILSDDINNNTKGVLTGDEVLKQMPDYPNVFSSSESFYEYAGIYFIRENNFDKALQCFSKAEKINPYVGRIDFYKQVISSKKGNLDSAYVYAQRAYSARPRNYDLYKTVSMYSTAKKDTTQLLKNHTLFSTYRNIPEEWVKTAKSLQNAGAGYNRLVEFLDSGLRKMPKDSTLLSQKNAFLITDYLIKGQRYESESKPDLALKTYQSALKIDPDNIYVLQNIGFYYLKNGQYDKAILNLTKALQKPGLNDGKTEYYLGMSFQFIKDKANACKYYRIALDKKFIDRNNPAIQNCG